MKKSALRFLDISIILVALDLRHRYGLCGENSFYFTISTINSS
ncbi:MULTISPECIES: hypothetical protein [Methanobacterium]|nr:MULTISPECIES: hypothetical protein [Methanobacterium]